MVARTPILPAALLAAILLGVALSGDSHSLLLLTPALALLIPLLFGAYPGERSVRAIASWFSSLGESGRQAALWLLPSCDRIFASLGTSAANGSRGPPR